VLHGIAGHTRRIMSIRDSGVVVAGDNGPVVAAAVDDLVSTLVAIEQDLGEGPATDALLTGSEVRVHAVVDVARVWPDWLREARAHNVGAWLAVPSRTEHAMVVLCGASSRPHQWRDDEVAAIQVLADLTAGAVAHSSELGRARRTADQLQEALDHRLVIEQAKGILAGELGCTLDHAFELLRSHARRNSATVRSVAQAVVNLGLRPPLDKHTGPDE
jgi:GAF domain-containing protein